MDFEAYRAQWAEQTARLEAASNLNLRVLSSITVDRAKTALDRHAFWLALEALGLFVVVFLLGSFLGSHWNEPRFAIPALVIDVLFIALFGDAVRQVVAARSIDHGRPVAEIQRRLETLRVARIRHEIAVLAVGFAAWVPLLAIALYSVSGVDAWSVLPAPWLAANVLLGFALGALGIVLARRWARSGRTFSPAVTRFLDDVAGPNLAEAKRFLAQVEEFAGVDPERR